MKQAAAGAKAADLCRKNGITETTPAAEVRMKAPSRIPRILIFGGWLIPVLGVVLGMWPCTAFTMPACDEFQIVRTIRDAEDAASSVPRGRVRALKERVGRMVENAVTLTASGDTGALLRKALLDQFAQCGISDVLVDVAGSGVGQTGAEPGRGQTGAQPGRGQSGAEQAGAGRGPDTLVVTVGFPSQCDGQPDETLYLLEKDGAQGWHVVLGYGYGLVDDVPHSLTALRLTSSAEQGYLAVDGVRPGCISEYRPWFVRLFGRDGQAVAALIGSSLESLEVHATEAYSVQFEGSALKLDFEDHGWLDTADVRRRVHTYCIEGRSVERCGSLGDSPAAFLEEWITAPWDVARRWVSRNDAALEAAHRRLASESGVTIQRVRAVGNETRVSLVREDIRDVQSPTSKSVAAGCVVLSAPSSGRGLVVEEITATRCAE